MAKAKLTIDSEDTQDDVVTTVITKDEPNTQLSNPSEQVAGLEGDFTLSDVKLPYVTVVQKTSDLVEAGFSPGSLVIKQGDSIVGLPASTSVTVLQLKKQYKEDLPYGSDAQPRVFDTVAEVRSAGGSTEYGSENYFHPIASIQLLVEAPSGLDDAAADLFPYDFNGKAYAIAVLTASKTGYSSVAKPVITALMSFLKGKAPSGKWTLSSEKRTNAKNSWYVPVIRINGRNDSDFAEFAGSFV